MVHFYRSCWAFGTLCGTLHILKEPAYIRLSMYFISTPFCWFNFLACNHVRDAYLTQRGHLHNLACRNTERHICKTLLQGWKSVDDYLLFFICEPIISRYFLLLLGGTFSRFHSYIFG